MRRPFIVRLCFPEMGREKEWERIKYEREWEKRERAREEEREKEREVVWVSTPPPPHTHTQSLYLPSDQTRQTPFPHHPKSLDFSVILFYVLYSSP